MIQDNLTLSTLHSSFTSARININNDYPFIVMLSEKRWEQLLEAIDKDEVKRMVRWEEEMKENKEWTKKEDFRMILGFWNTLWIKDKKI